MADVKTISGVFTGHMLNILLPKSQFRFGLGIMSWQDGTGAMAVPCGDERDYAFANFLKDKAECRK
jgi:leucyl-tRNA synthetase